MYKIIVDHNPNDKDNEIIRKGVFNAHKDIVGEPDKEFSIFLKNEDGKIVGGIQAGLDKQSVYIDLLWVDEALRSHGYGKKLLDAAEQEGIKNGCIYSTTDTWDFQAEDFYLKCGYERIGEIKNYWFEHSKIFLRKKLTH